MTARHRLTDAQARVLTAIDRGADSIVWSYGHRAWILMGANRRVHNATFWSLFRRGYIRAIGIEGRYCIDNLYEQSHGGQEAIAFWRETHDGAL